jgi:hypothetical protein
LEVSNPPKKGERQKTGYWKKQTHEETSKKERYKVRDRKRKTNYREEEIEKRR